MLIVARQAGSYLTVCRRDPIVTPVLPGFDYQHVPVADGVSLHVAVAGAGRPVVLLHGFPQTHLM